MKTFLILIFLSFSLKVSAQHLCKENDAFGELAAFMQELEWHGATDEQIKNAHCTRKDPFTDKEMRDWLDTHHSGKKESKTINGISFENENVENLRTFELLTTKFDYMGDVEKDNKTYISSCKKVDCALKEIFGDTSVQLQFLHRKFGFNGSHLLSENTSSWQKKELDTVLLSLTDFPEGILPVEESRKLVHFKRGYARSGSEYAMANAIIEVFDLWDTETPEKKRYTITHELGHVISGMTGLDEHDHFTHLSGWSKQTEIVEGKEKKTYTSSKPENIISRYGKTNNMEDFAESVAAYRYNPQGLKEKSPEKYDIIKEVIFDNVEYTSPEACQSPQRASETFKKKAQELVKNWKPSEAEIDQITGICSEKAIQAIDEKGVVDLGDKEFQDCYKDGIKAVITEKTKKSLTTENAAFMGPMFRNMKADDFITGDIASLQAELSSKHKEKLKAAWVKGLDGSFFFRPKEDVKYLEHIYQSFDKSLGFDPFSSRKKFASIATKLHTQLDQKSSQGKRFSTQDISDQVDRLFK